MNTRAGSGCQGQENREGAAGTQGALNLDPTAVGLGDGLRDAEAQAGAAGLARASLVRAVEALEDSGKGLDGDADSGVLNADLCEIATRSTCLGTVLRRL